MKELPWKARILVVAVLAAGAAASLHSLVAVWKAGSYDWLFLALLANVACLFTLRYPMLTGHPVGHDPTPHSVVLSLDEYFTILAWLVFSPEAAVLIAALVGLVVSLRTISQARRYRILYNLCSLPVAAWTASNLFYWWHGHPAPFRFDDSDSLLNSLLVLGLSVMVHFLINIGLVGSVVGLAGGPPLWMHLRNHLPNVFGPLACASAAAVNYFAFPNQPLVAGLAGIPALWLVYAFHSVDFRRLATLAKSQAFLQGSLDALSSAIAVLDHSGRIVATNEFWRNRQDPRRPFGSWLKVGDNYLDACRGPIRRHVHAAETIARGIEAVLGGAQNSFALEYASGTSDAAWHDLRVSRLQSSPPQRIVIAHRDITDRVESASRLRESEAKYRRFFENDLTGDFVAEASGELIDCNPAFARMFSFGEPEQALKSNFFALFPVRARVRELIDTLRKQGKVEYFQTEARTVDGGAVSVVCNFTARLYDNGELAGVRGYLFDDTRRKNLEEALIQAQKMEAVGQLAGGMAHEFNNFLTVVAGYAEFLRDSLHDHIHLRDEASLVLNAAKRGGGLTEQLLVFSGRSAPVAEAELLDRLVEEATAMLGRALGDRIRLALDLGAPGAAVRIDRGQMGQVLLNLALNARDAMPEGGLLSMETRLAGPGHAVVRVSDTGSGMPQAVKERIFEPFFTTKEKGHGTGLGLATVREIILQTGGRIKVHSQPGRGTVFEIDFPVGPPPRPDRPPRPASADGGSETVLVVEDQPEIRRLVTETLRRRGYQVVEASDGAEAVGFLEATQRPVHLLLTDLVMPRMGGSEMVRRLRKSGSVPPRILCISGYADIRGDSAAPSVEGLDYLPKPFTPSQLAAKVRQVLDGC